MNRRTQTRIPQELHDEASKLVGHEHHTSFNVVVIKALQAYCRLNSNLIAKIDKREGKR